MSARLVNTLSRAGLKGVRSSGNRPTRVMPPRRAASVQASRETTAAAAPGTADALPKQDQKWTEPGSDYSKFEAASAFHSLDSNKDGVLSREEVVAGAWRFNMQPHEASALFDRLDANGDGVLTPIEWAANAWDASVGKHMSYSSAESDFGSVRESDMFQSLDANHDGVLSREEVVEGAWRFNMQPADASALFDRLDANGDGVLSPREWEGAVWEASVGKHMNFAGDFVVPFDVIDANHDGVLSREEVVAAAWRFNMQPADASALFDRLDANGDGKLSEREWTGHVWEASVGKHMNFAGDYMMAPASADELNKSVAREAEVAAHMSFAGAESDFVAPRAAELDALKDAAPPTHDWLLFPTSISFAGADNDWCAPLASEIEAGNAYQDAAPYLSWASPLSDWMAPSKAEIEAPVAPTTLSFASPESDFIATRAEDIARSVAYDAETNGLAHLSFAGAESDFTAPNVRELERAEAARTEFDSSSLSYAHLSFATPTADFLSAYPEEQRDVVSLSEALAPSNEARVLTSADGRFRIQHVNDAWTRLCGYTQMESHGKTLGILQGDATDDKAVDELVAMLRQGKSSQAVLVNYDRYGRKFRNHLQTTPVVSDETGEITHFLGKLRDIGGADNKELASAQAVMNA